MRLLRMTRKLIFAGLLMASLALNVATVALAAVSDMVSGIYERVTGLESVSGERKREVESKDRRIASMSDDLDTKDRRIASLSDEVTSLKETKAVTYRGQKRMLSEAVEDTAERIATRTASGATRNVASIFAEALPFVGVGVVVGVTAWEINDACETMKDLQELDLAFNPDSAVDPEVTQVCGLDVPSSEAVWQTAKASPGKAWASAKSYVPDLPEWPGLPELASWPTVDLWPFGDDPE